MCSKRMHLPPDCWGFEDFTFHFWAARAVPTFQSPGTKAQSNLGAHEHTAREICCFSPYRTHKPCLSWSWGVRMWPTAGDGIGACP